MGSGFEIVIVFAVFLGLLAAGMSIPFAIATPALFYLLLHGGPDELKGLGLVSWGSMNSFTLTAVPMYILMAQILEHSGLGSRIYTGLARFAHAYPADCCKPTSQDAPSLPQPPVRASRRPHR
jgi:C4-dicarboxylate transporter DctM subunit